MSWAPRVVPQAIRVAVVSLNRPLEGFVPWLYLDSKFLPTIGVGLLVTSFDEFAALGLVRKDSGLPATIDELRADWLAVHRAHPGAASAAAVTQCELTGVRIGQLIDRKLEENEGWQFEYLGDALENLPYDMRVCNHSMQWAMGSHFFTKFPKYTEAMKRGDFLTDEKESDMPEGEDGRNPNLHPRNVADGILCRNAAEVKARGLDPRIVYYPEDLCVRETSDTEPAPPSQPTRPDLPGNLPHD